MEDLKKLSQNIRLKYKDRSRVPWPTSFKQIIIKELSSGKKLSEIIKATGLQHQVIKNWQKSEKLKKNLFKKLHVTKPNPFDSHLTLISKTGLQVKGLRLSDLYELFKQGVL